MGFNLPLSRFHTVNAGALRTFWDDLEELAEDKIVHFRFIACIGFKMEHRSGEYPFQIIGRGKAEQTSFKEFLDEGRRITEWKYVVSLTDIVRTYQASAKEFLEKQELERLEDEQKRLLPLSGSIYEAANIHMDSSQYRANVANFNNLSATTNINITNVTIHNYGNSIRLKKLRDWVSKAFH